MLVKGATERYNQRSVGLKEFKYPRFFAFDIMGNNKTTTDEPRNVRSLSKTVWLAI